jgi:hypothetical protein
MQIEESEIANLILDSLPGQDTVFRPFQSGPNALFS